ncbi:MAG: 2-C-methyl-D-erythritol 2,4-cyclodiphosphate synthase [Pseudomonadota bacterium]
MRIGHGYDAHRFNQTSKNPEQQFITIGGVKIPHTHSLIAHSDGDVLIHALCDALLGALALGDIGRHFPDTDIAFKNIDSRKLLKDVMNKVTRMGYQLGNADITVIAQSPKMSPHIENMQSNLAIDCLCQQTQINVKATTTEKMGFTGRKEGIATHVVVLLIKINS